MSELFEQIEQATKQILLSGDPIMPLFVLDVKKEGKAMTFPIMLENSNATIDKFLESLMDTIRNLKSDGFEIVELIKVMQGKGTRYSVKDHTAEQLADIIKNKKYKDAQSREVVVITSEKEDKESTLCIFFKREENQIILLEEDISETTYNPSLYSNKVSFIIKKS